MTRLALIVGLTLTGCGMQDPIPAAGERNRNVTEDRIAAPVAVTAPAAVGPSSRPSPPRPPRAARHRAATGVWDRLAHCESTSRWDANTGNGYYGGLQFSLRSWRWVGGKGYPHHASRDEQILRAKRLLARQGWGAWPACSRKLGLR